MSILQPIDENLNYENQHKRKIYEDCIRKSLEVHIIPWNWLSFAKQNETSYIKYYNRSVMANAALQMHINTQLKLTAKLN